MAVTRPQVRGARPPDPPDPAGRYDEIADAVLVVGPTGLVLEANRAARVLLAGRGSASGSARGAAPGSAPGAAPSVVVGPLTGRLLDQVAPLVDAAGRSWWTCEATARSMRGVSRIPERQLSLHGHAVLLTGSYVRSAGVVERVVLTLRDAGSRERLERGNAELISTVAHELRSPLTSVKGFSATMLARWERFTDEQKRQMLEWINNDADRVTRLLTELLDVSRIDAGRLQVRREPVDLRVLVERAFAGRAASGVATRLVLESSGEPPVMWLDPDKMEQVIANLVENGLRHGRGGVTVTIVGRPGGASLLVDDEGDGVPAEFADRVFSKFFRGKARSGGTGLGLYIVRGLLEAQGGSVALERAPSGGARFRCELPAGSAPFAD